MSIPVLPANILPRYEIRAPLGNVALNTLFAAAWPQHTPRDFQPVLEHSLTYISAHVQEQATGETLIGFANVAWDGGVHAFLLDVTVHPHRQRQGIGLDLVRHAIAATRVAPLSTPIQWLHVDYEPYLDGFYRACGFRPTHAGLIAL